MIAASPRRPSQRDEPLGIIAGGGVLPRLIAEEARKLGWAPNVIAIAEGRHSDWTGFTSAQFHWNRTGDLFPFLSRQEIRTLVFCGTISIRPDYRSFLPSFQTLLMLPELLKIVRGGDDSLLRAVSLAFERRGYNIISVQEIMPALLLPTGRFSGRNPTAREGLAVQRAASAAKSLGLMDIGQAVVASPDRVIAMEGIEGTREMLVRVAGLAERGRIGRAEPCVLFKGFKPQQDPRFDLPSIGVETVDQVTAAGIVGIAMSAGHSLVIDPQAVVERASSASIFIHGVSVDDEANNP